RTRPARACDGEGDFGERSIAAPGVIETLIGYGDHVGAPAPLADQPGTRLDLRTGIRADLAIGFELLGQAGQLAPRGLRQTAMGQLLQPVGDRTNDQVTAEAWRLSSEQASPFGAKLRQGQLLNAPDLLRQASAG